MPAELSIHQYGKPVQVVRLDLERYEVGRADFNTLCFRHVPGVSRRHAAFAHDSAGWSVCDLGSTNGTFVNAIRVAGPRILRSGDRVTVGKLNIVFSEAFASGASGADSKNLFVEKKASPADITVEATLAGVLSADSEIQTSPHLRALVEAGRELCGHLSLHELFEVILHLSVDTVGASRGALITLDAGEFQVRAAKGAGFRISTHVRDLVVNERRSILVRDALIEQGLSERESIVQDQIRGILAVPLQTEKQVIGLIYLDSPVHIRHFTKDDLNVLTVLANIAAVRIEQARLTEIEQAQLIRARELEQAALIQRSMLPGEIPAFPHRHDFRLHAAMVPAREVGGDLFDYFLLDEHRLALVIGDVSGKGVPAALFMAVARTLLRATAQNQKGPGECFTYMNNALAEGNSAGMFVTLFYGVLNTRTGEMEFANAGHNRPYVFSPDGTLRKLCEKSGPMLGVFEGREYKTLTAQIASGEGILLYTDGVTEAMSRQNEFFGDDRLEEYLTSHVFTDPQALVQNLHAAVRDFAKGMPQADDITVLGLLYGAWC